MRVAWLSVDEEDAEPLQFFAYLTAALEASGIEVGHLGPVRRADFRTYPSLRSSALTGAIERSTARTVVIIDDYQRLSLTDRAAMSWRGAGRSSNARGAHQFRDCRPLATALRPALAADRLEIGADELRFTDEETRRLLKPGAAALSDEELSGWPRRGRLGNRARDGAAVAGAGWRAERVLAALANPGTDLQPISPNRSCAARTRTARVSAATCVVDRFSRELAVALFPTRTWRK